MSLSDEYYFEVHARKNYLAVHCHGCSGWFLSDFDTWETCPRCHQHGQPHPEDEGEVWEAWRAMHPRERFAVEVTLRPGKRMAVDIASTFPVAAAVAQEYARDWRATTYVVRLNTPEQIARAEFQLEKIRDWASDAPLAA